MKEFVHLPFFLFVSEYKQLGQNFATSKRKEITKTFYKFDQKKPFIEK